MCFLSSQKFYIQNLAKNANFSYFCACLRTRLRHPELREHFCNSPFILTPVPSLLSGHTGTLQLSNLVHKYIGFITLLYNFIGSSYCIKPFSFISLTVCSIIRLTVLSLMLLGLAHSRLNSVTT